MLADLSSYYTDDLKKDILPSYLEAATGDDGKIYTLPFECETLGLFYDADVLKEEGIEPPTTWEELKSAAEKLTTDDRYGIVLPVEKQHIHCLTGGHLCGWMMQIFMMLMVM